MQFEVFPDRLHLRHVDPVTNMRRFYLMTVQRDLFGGAQLTNVSYWAALLFILGTFLFSLGEYLSYRREYDANH